MLRSHRIRLDPTLAQAIYFAKGCGVARFSYNWALARWQAQYEAHLKDPSLPLPNEAALRRELNAIKRTEFPWMMEVTKCAPQEVIRALGVAYKNWFQSLSSKRKGPKLAQAGPKLAQAAKTPQVAGNRQRIVFIRLRRRIAASMNLPAYDPQVQAATLARLKAHLY